jgi:hypothetical protein
MRTGAIRAAPFDDGRDDAPEPGRRRPRIAEEAGDADQQVAETGAPASSPSLPEHGRIGLDLPHRAHLHAPLHAAEEGLAL